MISETSFRNPAASFSPAGSQQLRRFRVAIRGGMGPEQAAHIAGIGLVEASLILADDMKAPPLPEAYQPLALGFCAACGLTNCSHSDAEYAGVVPGRVGE